MLDDGKTTMDVPLQLAGGGFSFVSDQMRRWVDEVLGPEYSISIYSLQQELNVFF